MNDEKGELSHLDAHGRARMVDVGAKAVTARSATATGRLNTTAAVVALVRADKLPKADVLATARIAGISGAKRTSELIPLCHQLALSSVTVDFSFTDEAILVTATAKTIGQTGVEMEALTAVAVAGLTLHDMVKAVDARAMLGEIRLEAKSGGKRGDWSREAGTATPAAAVVPNTATVVVASTRAAAGTHQDTTGPQIAAWLAERGFAVSPVTVVADAQIAVGLTAALALAPALIITTGGTGLSPSDRTPEATLAIIDRELAGVAEAIRARGLLTTPTAALSRAVAGTANGTLIINLPGSVGGVGDGLAVLDGLLNHLLAQISGGGKHD